MAEPEAAVSLPEALSKAGEAFGTDRYDEAVKWYEKCMELEPGEHRHQLSRARAYVKLGKFIEALSDTSAVIGRLPTLASAHQLKGEALFHCEEYESALDAFKDGLEHASARVKPNIEKWVDATQACIAGRDVDVAQLKPFSAAANAKEKGHVPAPPATQASRNALSASPSKDSPAADQPSSESWTVDPDADKVSAAMARPGPSVKASELSNVPFTSGVPLDAASKYRWQYYQTANKVTLQVFVKKLNRNANRVNVVSTEDHIKVEIKDENCEAVEYTVDEQLYARVVPDKTVISVLGANVEVSMLKADNTNWPSLQSSDIKVASNWSDDKAAEAKKTYPTSSKAPKDWDKLETEVKEEEKTEDLQGDAALQRLFKQIYSNADEDTRRAMNKSFQESSGTVLSTNWKDVGAKKIECTPPDGVKLNKFDS